ncbi:MAG: DUF3616 domain-containing protein, partial [Solirubrobacteraceae bacterium]|nr:DUF3616 domain-containing protein [Solirubrobacteraceae bacterium]
EGVSAQFATLAGRGLVPTEAPFRLLSAGKELDAEGAASDGEFFYVVGSHSVKRKDCASNPFARQVLRFKVAGTPAPEASRRLWESMQREPLLGRHADGCLGVGTGGNDEQMARRPGLNIEGMAASGGRLYFGFRAPSLDGVVPVYSVGAAALFGDGDLQPQLANLRVGAGSGIRDMVAAGPSILLLIGPDDRPTAGTPSWRIAAWTPDAAATAIQQPRMLAALDLSTVKFDTCADAPKPEALAILEETESAYRVLVLSDGVCDGGPLVFNLAK